MARKSFKAEGFTPVGNREQNAAMMELRRSSATSPQDTRPHRERSRKDAKTKAIKRSLNDN